MDNQELQTKIEDIEKTLEDFKAEMEEKRNEFDEFKSRSTLDRNLDVFSKDIIKDVIRDNMAEIWWDDIFYISSVFESIDRYLVTGDASISTSGLSVSMGSGLAFAILEAKDNNPILANRKTFFSSPVGIHGIVDATYSVIILDGAVYFEISEGVITGHTYDGTEYTVALGSVANNTPVLLECVYYPQYRVDFFVDGVLKGTLSNGLIATSTVISDIVQFQIEPNSGADSNDFTANSSTDIITLASGSWLEDNVPVVLTTTDTLPAGLSTSTVYWTVNSSGGNTCKLSLTTGGSVIDITDTGTGTHTITRDTSVAEVTYFQLLQKK